VADGDAHVRLRFSSARMPAAAHQGRGLPISPDSRSRCQGTERSCNRATQYSARAASNALAPSACPARSRSSRRIRSRLSTTRVGIEVPERRSRMGMAVRLPFVAPLHRSEIGNRAPPSCTGGRSAARSQASHTQGRDRKARQRPYTAAFIRNAPARIGLRHPHRTGIARPRGT
jgi:hypothetical protein